MKSSKTANKKDPAVRFYDDSFSESRDSGQTLSEDVKVLETLTALMHTIMWSNIYHLSSQQ